MLLTCQGLGLAVDSRKPMVVVVSRLTGQKNPGLMQVSVQLYGTDGLGCFPILALMSPWLRGYVGEHRQQPTGAGTEARSLSCWAAAHTRCAPHLTDHCASFERRL